MNDLATKQTMKLTIYPNELNPRHAHLRVVQDGGLAGAICVDREWWDRLVPDSEEGVGYVVEMAATGAKAVA